MREIKFRGKKLGTGNWAYGFLAGIEGLRIGRTGRIVSYDGENIYDSLVYADTIGQYTGLDDANGEEIYEGDIISSDNYPNIKHLIYYDSAEACFMAKYAIGKNDYSSRAYQEWIDECGKQVIGNIYDNPELIEK